MSVTETRNQIIGLCRQEAHANLQRHIRTGGLHLSGLRPRRFAKTYTVHSTSTARPRTLSIVEILALAAIVVFRV